MNRLDSHHESGELRCCVHAREHGRSRFVHVLFCEACDHGKVAGTDDFCEWRSGVPNCCANRKYHSDLRIDSPRQTLMDGRECTSPTSFAANNLPTCPTSQMNGIVAREVGSCE